MSSRRIWQYRTHLYGSNILKLNELKLNFPFACKLCVFFFSSRFGIWGSCQPLGHIVMVNGVATATAPPAAHGIRVNSAVFVRHPCGGCACVLYIVSHRNSLLSIFLYIFATFQHTLSYTRITAFSAENVVEHCSCSNLFPFSFFPVDVLWFLL